MQTHRYYSLPQTVVWSQRYVIGPLVYASAVGAVYLATELEALRVPWTPVSLVGVAVAFFVGFKNNASYARLWEARQIWGAIVNTSRAWGLGVKDLITDPFAPNPIGAAPLREVQRELVYRHLGWLTAVRHALRAPRDWEHAGAADAAVRAQTRERQVSLPHELGPLIDAEEAAGVLARANPAAQLLARQSSRLRELRADGRIDDFRHVFLQQLLNDLLDHQGKAERMKNFPFPRQYATITRVTVWLLAAVLPFALLDVFAGHGPLLVALMVLSSTVISWVFFVSEMVGDYSENPFEGLPNDVPITTLARAIEIDLREMLDEADIPPPLRPTDYGLLM
jgi:ion channel-forming bestrophin family protein